MSTISMTTGTSTSNLSLTGLGTNIDWQSMLTELTTVSEEALTPYNSQISVCNSQISAWQSFGGLLSSLQTASDALTSAGTGLDVYSANVSSSSSVSASSLLSASASSSASNGNYQVVISKTAQAEKLGSGSFTSQSSALNISGTILVNGHGCSDLVHRQPAGYREQY